MSNVSLSSSRSPSQAKTHTMHSRSSSTAMKSNAERGSSRDATKELGDSPAKKLEVALSNVLAKCMVPREPQNAPDAWSQSADEISSHEKDRVQRLRNEINTLLVLSCLFSVVIAAFLGRYYALTRPAQDFNTGILEHISSQLGSLAPKAALAAADSSTPRFLTSTSLPSPPPLWIAPLWFASLALSLGAASVALALKQWLSVHAS